MTGMEELLEDLESRTDYVITLWRTEENDMDAEAKNAFAFVLGKPEGAAIIIEGTVSGDGLEAVVTAWATNQHGRVTPDVTVLGDSVMITQRLD